MDQGKEYQDLKCKNRRKRGEGRDQEQGLYGRGLHQAQRLVHYTDFSLASSSASSSARWDFRHRLFVRGVSGLCPESVVGQKSRLDSDEEFEQVKGHWEEGISQCSWSFDRFSIEGDKAVLSRH